MIVGRAVETTVDSNDASAVTRRSANVTARRRFGSKRGGRLVTRAPGYQRARPVPGTAGTSQTSTPSTVATRRSLARSAAMTAARDGSGA